VGIAAVLSASLTLVVLSAPAGADEPHGQGGQKLKWLPYRPSTASAVIQTAAVERSVPAAGRSVAAAQRPRGEAFADPFGDARASAPTLDLAAVPEDGLAEDGWSEDSLREGSLPETLDDLDWSFPSEGFSEDQPAPDLGLPLMPGDDLLAGDEDEPLDECPSPYDPDFFKRIDELTTDITPEDGEFPRHCPLTYETIRPFAPGQVRSNPSGAAFVGTSFTWTASSLCHKPLYFEDQHLERYGHSWGPRLQPVMSGARFFLTVPALPYEMGLYPPWECIYPLGYYRPGSCAPYMLDPLPLSVRAALVEGGVWTGMAALVP
jgi:hypothetical protein